MSLDLGSIAPDFELASSTGENFSLKQFKNDKIVILSFHPMSFTGGWTHQVSSFRRKVKEFEEKSTQVLGLSIDSAAVQKTFSTALGGLPYPLLADFHPKGEVAELYDVWNPDKGTSLRAVAIVDKQGILRFRQIYQSGQLPDPEALLVEVDKYL